MGAQDSAEAKSSRSAVRPRAEQTRRKLRRAFEVEVGAVGPQAHPAGGENAVDGTMELLDKVLQRENMLRALSRVEQNKGAAGVDGMTVDDLRAHLREHWPRIREEVLSGTYQPHPVRRVEIPKPGGKGTRMLGIPTVLDRLLQQALLQQLHPIFDPTFSDGSFGFRPGRGTHHAIERARTHVASGRRWVVDLDLEKFFDRVNHDVLMARVARRVKDKRVLLLIRRFLQAGIMEDGLVSQRVEGTPQGGPLSPLLSNILLDELDKELERRGHRFVRYADDCNVYVQSQAAGHRVMASLERFLRERLRLKVNRDKSAVARPWERKFLGYTVTHEKRPKLKVAPQSVKRLRDKLQPIFRAGRGRPLARTIQALNRILTGWRAYFRKVEVLRIFEDLDGWIRRKLRCIVWRQWKRPKIRERQLKRRGISPADAKATAYNGRGPWYNAGSQWVGKAIPTAELRKLGLVPLVEAQRRLAGVV
jgi:RNA-directed DNA polymerase